MSLSVNVSEKAALIWAIADKLTGVYKPHEYGEIILPLTVLRRFDCILADTKDKVVEKYESVKEIAMKDILLRQASQHDFYNTSKYTFEKLLDDPDNIEINFRDFINGFSQNVLDIYDNRLNNVDAFIKEKVSVDKVVSSECKALIRFKKPQKDKIIQIIKDKFKEAEVIAQDDELAVVVDAPSECAINDSIKFIEDNNYCEDASKILKLS